MKSQRNKDLTHISVIIPTFNRANALKVTIDSVVNQNLSPEQYEILIVDNGSTDTTKDVVNSTVKAFPAHNIRYFFEPIPGLLSGRHRGALEAKGDILVFIDDDIEADRKWLKAIRETFDNDPGVQLVGGRNLPRYKVRPPKWLDLFWTDLPYGRMMTDLSLLDLGNKTRIINANYVWGLNFSIRKEALLDLGGFHPDCIPKHLQHFQGDGETGLTMKANEQGCKAIYQPKALIYHNIPPGRMTYEYFDDRYFYEGVCNSFTDFRIQHDLYKADTLQSGDMNISVGFIEKTRKNLREIVRKVNKNKSNKRLEKELRERFHGAYLDGYRFHQETVKRNPELLKWVLKENYWDYRLPELTLNKRILFSNANLITERTIYGLEVEGLGETEGPYPQWDLPRVRWAKKSRVTIVFNVTEEDDFSFVAISMSFRAQVRPVAHMILKFNGKKIKSYEIIGAENWHDDDLNLVPDRGSNLIEFLFEDSSKVPPPQDLLYMLFRELFFRGVRKENWNE
jgi:glucosyl-dolichyl phosphate glucuronosyltransferase